MQRTVVVKGGRPEAWERTVLDVLEGLSAFDLTDAYRALHGLAPADSYVDRVSGRGRRYDHVFGWRALNAAAVRYLHEFRERGLSDHSPVEVDFAPEVRDSS